MNFDLQLPPECPNQNIDQFEGTAYRVVMSNPPLRKDLETHSEMGKALGANECLRCSISLFNTYERAKHLLDMRPQLGNHIASIKITKSHGKVDQPNKNGHIDWWPYLGMRNESDLQVVES